MNITFVSTAYDYACASSSSQSAILMKIATRSGKMNACIHATNSPWIYNISGASTGNWYQNESVVNVFMALISNHNSTHHANIFPYNLADKEITFAISHIISNSHTNIDISISNIFTNQATSRYATVDIFHFSAVRTFFQVIGRYSWIRAHKDPVLLYWTASITKTLITASQILNVISTVGIVMYCVKNSGSTNTILTKSRSKLDIFASIIIENNVITYIFVVFFAFFPRISSKKLYISSIIDQKTILGQLFGKSCSNHPIRHIKTTCNKSQTVDGLRESTHNIRQVRASTNHSLTACGNVSVKNVYTFAKNCCIGWL